MGACNIRLKELKPKLPSRPCTEGGEFPARSAIATGYLSLLSPRLVFGPLATSDPRSWSSLKLNLERKASTAGKEATAARGWSVVLTENHIA